VCAYGTVNATENVREYYSITSAQVTIGLKKLRLSPWRLNYLQKEVRSEMGLGVWDQPNENKE
jgi:hypothetical protein